MVDPSTQTVLLTTVAALGVAGVIWRVARFIVRGLRRIGHFLDDFNGENARRGQKARPGVLERLASVEHEFHPNDGATLRDAVDRTESKADAAALKAEEAVEVAKTANDLVVVAMDKFTQHLTRYHQRRDDTHERREDT